MIHPQKQRSLQRCLRFIYGSESILPAKHHGIIQAHLWAVKVLMHRFQVFYRQSMAGMH